MRLSTASRGPYMERNIRNGSWTSLGFRGDLFVFVPTSLGFLCCLRGMFVPTSLALSFYLSAWLGSWDFRADLVGFSDLAGFSCRPHGIFAPTSLCFPADLIGFPVNHVGFRRADLPQSLYVRTYVRTLTYRAREF